MGTLLRQIAQDAAPDVRTVRPELPGALADVVALALQKRAAYRYADGLQMAADLQAVARFIDRGTVAPLSPCPAEIDMVFDMTVDVELPGLGASFEPRTRPA